MPTRIMICKARVSNVRSAPMYFKFVDGLGYVHTDNYIDRILDIYQFIMA
jgi:hypothetical protein